MEKLYILDAVNFLFRSYYAIGPMTNDRGESTSALYGFIRSIQKIQKEFNPSHMAVVFDGPDNKKSRQAVYAEYKMNRKGAPEDLFPQFEWAYEFCEKAGLPVICIPNVEADDTIASITKWAEKKGSEVYICSSDKDLFQLVSKKVFVLQPNKDNLLVDENKVEEIYGVTPSQMLDFLAIMGDASDNIPGLEGFGPKTAATLLQKFKTLDYILEHPLEVPGKKKQETLQTQKDRALMSRELATLDTTIEFQKTNEFFRVKDPNISLLADLYRDMKFSTLLKDLGEVEKAKPKIIEEEPVDLSYVLVNDTGSFNEMMLALSGAKEISVDTETTSLHPLLAKLVGVGFATQPGKAWYVPFNGNLPHQFLLKELKSLLENKNTRFIGHNLKYDFHVFKNYGIEIKNIGFDTILASYLLAPHQRRHGLDQLALEKFGKHKIAFKSLIGEGKNKKELQEVSLEKVKEYCCEDVDYTFRLKTVFEKELKNTALEKILHKIEIPLLPILAEMERNGIYLCTQKLTEMTRSLVEQIHLLEREIYNEVGEEFNLNSPKQLSEILYNRLGLTPPSRKKTEYSTSAKVLELLSEESSVASKVLQYRGLEKLRSTYVEALPKQVNPNTNRVHCTFNQSVTATGRLSCQDPNLQNIPVRTKEGRKIRAGFKPQHSNWSYLSADYSQIELRLLAHLSNDPQLIKAFHENQDIHTYTASLVFNVPVDKVTKDMRYQAKAVNFGILYGQGPFGLSQELGIPMREASNFIKTYFARYPKVLEFIDICKQKVKETNESETLTGRTRPIPEITSKNPTIRSMAERLAVNTPLQGSAADLIKLAMIEVQKEIHARKLQGFMVLQIHDELIFEVPDMELMLFESFVKEKMENVFSLKVPLVVDIEIGKNWAEC